MTTTAYDGASAGDASRARRDDAECEAINLVGNARRERLDVAVAQGIEVRNEHRDRRRLHRSRARAARIGRDVRAQDDEPRIGVDRALREPRAVAEELREVDDGEDLAAQVDHAQERRRRMKEARDGAGREHLLHRGDGKCEAVPPRARADEAPLDGQERSRAHDAKVEP